MIIFMRNRVLFYIAFYSVLIISMIIVRRLFGDWADGIFIAVLAFVGVLFWLIRKRKKK
jgi:LPXTG-motif cell wall-anchored protein